VIFISSFKIGFKTVSVSLKDFKSISFILDIVETAVNPTVNSIVISNINHNQGVVGSNPALQKFIFRGWIFP
jgi:hypothetical protein